MVEVWGSHGQTRDSCFSVDAYNGFTSCLVLYLTIEIMEKNELDVLIILVQVKVLKLFPSPFVFILPCHQLSNGAKLKDFPPLIELVIGEVPKFHQHYKKFMFYLFCIGLFFLVLSSLINICSPTPIVYGYWSVISCGLVFYGYNKVDNFLICRKC